MDIKIDSQQKYDGRYESNIKLKCFNYSDIIITVSLPNHYEDLLH